MTTPEASWLEADLASLFLVDDPALQADAMRQALVPQLAEALFAAMGEVARVYRVDPKRHSAIVRSPGAKDGRRAARQTFDVARAALGPARRPGGWRGVRAPDGGPREYVALSWGLEATHDGVSAVVALQSWWPLRHDDYRRLLERWLDHEGLVQALADYAGGMTLQYAAGAEGPVIRPLRDIVAALLASDRVAIELRSATCPWPVSTASAEQLIHGLVSVYPVYDMLLAVCAGRADRLPKLVACANAHIAREDAAAAQGGRASLAEGADDADVAPADDERLVGARARAREFAARQALVGVSRRYDVLHRDGFRCQDCGRSARTDPTVELHVDHWVPRSHGGTDDLDNLRTLCAPCNLGRSDRFRRDVRTR